MKGVVVKTTGNLHWIEGEDLKQYICVLKGKYRLDEHQLTNPIAVGDHVAFEWNEEKQKGVITQIYPRKNYILRKATKLSRRYHIIASNVDLALIFFTIKLPKVLPAFIDRLLVAVESFRIPAAIVFNKIDLYDEDDQMELSYWKDVYESIGYECIPVSAVTHTGLEIVKEKMKNKVCVMTGNSGTGKSSLLKAIAPELQVRIGEISAQHLTGKHTTTFAQMYRLSFGAQLIDTPGLRAFAPVDIEKQHLSHYFPEMRIYLNQCKFNDCRHINEPGCAVLAALEEGKIAPSRYQSYLDLYFDDNNDPYRRDEYA
ncbi:MAG: putative ribosome biogenesis GTPase RsgA [Vicingaceae bacterium]|nr:MAG: putative ribosome biogenesis GTPase RsgA [Vicingaceae bacterium]